MIWVAVILGMCLIVACLALISYFCLRALEANRNMSQQFIDAHKATLETLERTHERNVAQNSSVLDRFMALDFSLFKAYQSTEGAEEGGFTDPDEDEEGAFTVVRGGREMLVGAGVEERLAAVLNEQQLLREDFGDDFWEREDARG